MGKVDLFDTSIAFASARALPQATSSAGLAADKRHKEELAHYKARWTLNAGVSVIPATFESGGRWHPSTIEHFKRYVKCAFPDNIKAFLHRLKATTQRVTVAIRRTTSEAVLLLDLNAKKYPSVALPGAAQHAAAA